METKISVETLNLFLKKSGIYLLTRDEIIADQAIWDDTDPAKDSDFAGYPYWLTTDDGVTPIGYSDLSELIKDPIIAQYL